MKRLLFIWVIALLISVPAGFANAQMYWEEQPAEPAVTQNDSDVDVDVDVDVPALKNTLLDHEIYDSYETMDVDPPSLDQEARPPAAVQSGADEDVPVRNDTVAPRRSISPGFDRLPRTRSTTPDRDAATPAPRTPVTTTPRPAETSPGSTPAVKPTTPAPSTPSATTKPPAGDSGAPGGNGEPVTKRMQWGQPDATSKPVDATPKFQWGQPKSDQ